MIFRLRIGSWRFTFTFARVADVIGVNSLLSDGNHILMWDFDDELFPNVEMALRWIQNRYRLPNIYILNTGMRGHYIAYCFKRVTWNLAVEIIASTPLVDYRFFKYGVYREKFTLRVSPKEGRKPRLIKILKSKAKETASIPELRSWVKYETLADNSPTGLVEVGR